MLLKLEWTNELDEVFRKIMSAIVCDIQSEDDNAKIKNGIDILTEIRKIIKPIEVPGEWYPLYNMLINLQSYRVITSNVGKKLTHEMFDISLNSSIDRTLMKVGRDWCEANHLEWHPEIESIYQNTRSEYYTQVTTLFECLLDMRTTIDTVLPLLIEFKEQITVSLGLNSLRNMNCILNKEGIKVADKIERVYRGGDDFIAYMQKSCAEIKARLAGYLSFKSEERHMETEEDYLAAQREFSESSVPICKFGIPPFDERLEIRTSDVITIVAGEGTGKTNLAVYVGVSALMEGNDILFMTGETNINKVPLMVQANYMYRRFKGLKVSASEIAEAEKIENTKVQDAIIMSRRELTSDKNSGIGHGHYVKRFTYETFYNDLEEQYLKSPNTRLIIVDHTDRLDSNGGWTSGGRLTNSREKVAFMYDQGVQFTDDYPCAIIFVAHTSSETSKNEMVGKKVKGTRLAATSSNTSKDADMVLYLTVPEVLKAEGMLLASFTKVRNFDDRVPEAVLKKDFVCSNFIYDEKFQMTTNDDMRENELLKIL